MTNLAPLSKMLPPAERAVLIGRILPDRLARRAVQTIIGRTEAHNIISKGKTLILAILAIYSAIYSVLADAVHGLETAKPGISKPRFP